MANHCIICYKGLGIPRPTGQNENDISSKSREKCEMFFKLLERYLKDPGDKCFQPFPVWENIFDAGAPISCGACQGVMESFCELFHQMKSIELLINWKLWTLKNIMYSAERVPSRLNQFKEAFMQIKYGNANGSGVEQLNLILNLKRDLIKKCRRKLRTTFPRLQLVKYQGGKDELQQPPTTVDDCVSITDVGITSNTRSSMSVPFQVTGNYCIQLNPSPMILEGDDASIVMTQDTEEPVAVTANAQVESTSSISKKLSIRVTGSSKRKKRNKLASRLERWARLKRIRKWALNRSNITKLRKAIPGGSESEAHSPGGVEEEFNFNDCEMGSPESCAVAEIEVNGIERSSISPTDGQIPAGETDLNGKPETMDDYSKEHTNSDVHIFQQNKTPLVIHPAPTGFSSALPSRNSITEEELHQANILNLKNVQTATTPNNSSDPEVVPTVDFTASTNFEEVATFSNMPLPNTPVVTATKEAGMNLEESVPTVTEAEVTEESSVRRLRPVHRCVKCIKTFSTAGRLLEHQLSHEEEYSDSKSTGEVDRSPGTENFNSLDDINRTSPNNKGRMSRETEAVNTIPCHIKNCKEVFYTEEDVQIHKQLHGKFNCSFCESSKDYAPDLAWHEIMEHSSIVAKRKFSLKNTRKRTFTCPRQSCTYLCNAKMTYINHHLSEHLRLCPLKKTQLCNICKATFFGAATRLKERIQRHYQSHHDVKNIAEGEVHKCDQDECPAYFLTLQQLVSHKTKFHQIENQYNCSDCSSTFKSASHLGRHISAVHKKRESSSSAFSANPSDNLLNDSESNPEVVPTIDFAPSTNFDEVVSFPGMTPGNTCDVVVAPATKAEMQLKEFILPSATDAEVFDFTATNTPDVHTTTEAEINLEESVPTVIQAEVTEGSVPTITEEVSSVGRLRAVHRCGKCMKTFSTPGRLLEHHWSHGEEECSDSTSTGEEDKSSEVEYPESDFSCSVDEDGEDESDSDCNARVISRNQRPLVQTGPKNTIPCEIKNCKEVFQAEEDVQIHKQLHGEFNCSFCESTKDYAPDLAWHEIMEHSTVIAKRKFTRKDTRRKTFTCPRQDCSYLCSKKTYYFNHHISEHLRLRLPKRSQSCDICKACFFGVPVELKQSLHRHYQSHHDIQNVAEGEVYKCDQDDCPAYFLNLRQLLIHKTKVHENENRYNCSDCNSVFKHASSLRRHNFEVHKKGPVSSSFAAASAVGILLNDSESDDSEPEYYNDNEISMFKEDVNAEDNPTVESSYPEDNSMLQHEKNVEPRPTKDTAYEETATADSGKNGSNADTNKCNAIKLEPSKSPNKTHRRTTRARSRVSVRRREDLSKKFKCFFCEVTKGFAREIARHEIREHSQATESSEEDEAKNGSLSFRCPRPNCSFCGISEQKYIEHFVLEHTGLIPIAQKRQTCTVCKLTLDLGTDMKEHYNTHHNLENSAGSDVKKCAPTWSPGCEAKVSTPIRLQSHERPVYGIEKRSTDQRCAESDMTSKCATEKNDELNFVCKFEKCYKQFKTNKLLDRHMETIHGQIMIQLYKCSTCEQQCWNEASLKQHVKSHSSVRLSLFKAAITKKGIVCTICKSKLTSTRPSAIERHYNTFHNLKNLKGLHVKKCVQTGCAAYFLTSMQLHKHERKVHGIDKRYTCADCNVTFVSSTGIKYHYRKKHSDELNYLCTFEQCHSRFKTNELLEGHVKAIHDQKLQLIKCPKCPKQIWGEGTLKQHLKSHSSVRKPRRKYICEHCGKVFKEKHPLEIHYLSHSGPSSWKFECSVCSRKCLTQQKLDEHMRTHTKEKPFVCEICGEKYAHRHNLRIHVNNKHGDVTQDEPRKFNTANLTSRKGIKRKNVEEETLSESSWGSDSDDD